MLHRPPPFQTTTRQWRAVPHIPCSSNPAPSSYNFVGMRRKPDRVRSRGRSAPGKRLPSMKPRPTSPDRRVEHEEHPRTAQTHTYTLFILYADMTDRVGTGHIYSSPCDNRHGVAVLCRWYSVRGQECILSTLAMITEPATGPNQPLRNQDELHWTPIHYFSKRPRDRTFTAPEE